MCTAAFTSTHLDAEKNTVYPACSWMRHLFAHTVAVWFSTKTNPRCFRCPLSFVGEIVIHPVFGNTPFPPAWHHNVITRCLCCSPWVIVNWRNGLLRSAVSTCLGCFCWNSLVSPGTKSRVSRVMMMTMTMITGRPLVLGGAWCLPIFDAQTVFLFWILWYCTKLLWTQIIEYGQELQECPSMSSITRLSVFGFEKQNTPKK